MYIRSKRIYFEDGVKDGYLVVEGKKIVGFLDASAKVDEFVDYSDYRIIPGIFDTHHHANNGYSPHGLEGGEEEVRHFLKGAASSGVSNIFATLEFHDDGSYDRLYKLSQEEVDGATILGIHSEDTERLGNRVGENADPINITKINMDLVKATWEHSHGMLKLCGIAPELPGSDEAIEYLTSKGVRVAMMHSESDYATALEGFKKGVTVSTHTANVMRGIHHRRMGGLGACLLDPDLNCEVICDGLHISPEMLELMFRVKRDFSKWMMISDNVGFAGAPVGSYVQHKGDSNYFNITEEGFCLSPKGRLCGSTLPVLHGIKVLTEVVGVPFETVLKMSSLNPCRVYGFTEKGSIAFGKDCDLAVITDDYKCVATYANGRKVFDCEVDKEIFNPNFLAEHTYRG